MKDIAQGRGHLLIWKKGNQQAVEELYRKEKELLFYTIANYSPFAPALLLTFVVWRG